MKIDEFKKEISKLREKFKMPFDAMLEVYSNIKEYPCCAKMLFDDNIASKQLIFINCFFIDTKFKLYAVLYKNSMNGENKKQLLKIFLNDSSAEIYIAKMLEKWNSGETEYDPDELYIEKVSVMC